MSSPFPLLVPPTERIQRYPRPDPAGLCVTVGKPEMNVVFRRVPGLSTAYELEIPRLHSIDHVTRRDSAKMPLFHVLQIDPSTLIVCTYNGNPPRMYVIDLNTLSVQDAMHMSLAECNRSMYHMSNLLGLEKRISSSRNVAGYFSTTHSGGPVKIWELAEKTPSDEDRWDFRPMMFEAFSRLSGLHQAESNVPGMSIQNDQIPSRMRCIATLIPRPPASARSSIEQYWAKFDPATDLMWLGGAPVHYGHSNWGVTLWNLAKEKELLSGSREMVTIEDHLMSLSPELKSYVYAMEHDAGRSLMYAGCLNGKIVGWDTRTFATAFEWNVSENKGVQVILAVRNDGSSEVSPDNSHLFLVYANGGIVRVADNRKFGSVVSQFVANQGGGGWSSVCRVGKGSLGDSTRQFVSVCDAGKRMISCWTIGGKILADDETRSSGQFGCCVVGAGEMFSGLDESFACDLAERLEFLEGLIDTGRVVVKSVGLQGGMTSVAWLFKAWLKGD